MTEEGALQHDILLALGARPGLLVERMNTGAAPGNWRLMVDLLKSALARGFTPQWKERAAFALKTLRLVRFGTPGGPDVRVTGAGRSIAIEVKTSTGRLSTDQRSWGRAFTAAGGVYVVARSVDEAVTAVERALVAHPAAPVSRGAMLAPGAPETEPLFPNSSSQAERAWK